MNTLEQRITVSIFGALVFGVIFLCASPGKPGWALTGALLGAVIGFIAGKYENL